MAKNRFQRTGKLQETRLLLLAALVLAGGVLPGWGDPQPSQDSSLNPMTVLNSVQEKTKSISAKPAKTPAQRKVSTAKTGGAVLAAGKRDPFKLPEVPSGRVGPTENILNSAPGGVLPVGNRGLIISQLRYEGFVREQGDNKLTAVVVNETKVAHFLHENDSVYNGVVGKITPDAVYFKENVLDANGRVTTREVVKRMGSAPGEGR